MAMLAPAVVPQGEIVGEIGAPTTQHLHYAIEFQEAIPSSLQAATRDPLGACALVCAFLLDPDPVARETQIAELGRVAPESMREETIRIWPEAKGIPAHARIPLIDLALPALRRLSLPQFEQFRRAQQALMASDNETDLFEYMLQKIVTRHLETHFFPAGRSVTQFYALSPLVEDCGVLLSATAYAGHADATEAQAAFAQGASLLRPHCPQ